MPVYCFKNEKTNLTEEFFLKVSELEEFKSSHPELKEIICAPCLSSGRSNAKPDKGFRDLLHKIKKQNRRSRINTFD